MLFIKCCNKKKIYLMLVDKDRLWPHSRNNVNNETTREHVSLGSQVYYGSWSEYLNA